MKPISSAITGALRQVETQQSSIGEQRGETGSGLALTADAARARLAKPPHETDRNLDQWLRSLPGVGVTVHREHRYPPEGGYYTIRTGVSVTGLTPDQRRQASQIFEAAMTPPTREQAEEWVAMLHVSTAHRTEGASTLALALDIYANQLTRYPTDVARQACVNLATRKQSPNWWPSLSEVIEECDQLSDNRAMFAERLRRMG